VRKIILLFGLVLFFGILILSCEKRDELNLKHAEGLVLYYGDPAVDGCGWIIQINKVDYSPVNLDAKFQKDSLKIVLDYQILKSTWNCGWQGSGIQQIKIGNIK